MSSARPPGGREAILYTRPRCPLCYELRRTAARAARRRAIRLRVVDVSDDPELLARYGHEVPVLALSGGRVLRGRVSAEDVEAALRAAALEVGVAGGRARGVPWLQRALAALRRRARRPERGSRGLPGGRME